MSALSAPTRSSLTRPSVGLLFNPTTPEVMADCADLVEHLSVNPGQMVHDLGDHSPVGERFAFPAPSTRPWPGRSPRWASDWGASAG